MSNNIIADLDLLQHDTAFSAHMAAVALQTTPTAGFTADDVRKQADLDFKVYETREAKDVADVYHEIQLNLAREVTQHMTQMKISVPTKPLTWISFFWQLSVTETVKEKVCQRLIEKDKFAVAGYKDGIGMRLATSFAKSDFIVISF